MANIRYQTYSSSLQHLGLHGDSSYHAKSNISIPCKLHCTRMHTLRNLVGPDTATNCQVLDGKSSQEKLHRMVNEEFLSVGVDEESGLAYGPFKHAFICIATQVLAACKL